MSLPQPPWLRAVVRWTRPLRTAAGLRVRIIAASAWRRVLRRTTFIAITGSCGKTTAKELLAHVLGEKARSICNFRSVNDIWEVTRVVLRCRPWHRYAIAEIATAAAGDVERSARVFRPDVAVMLAVRLEHYASFRTLENVAAEKAALLRYVRPGGTVYLNADDASVAAMDAPKRATVVRFGCAPEAHVRATDVVSAWPQRLRFRVTSRRGCGAIETQVLGGHLMTPVLAAAAVSLGCGYAFDDVAAAIRRFPGFPGRMMPVELPGGVAVIRDEYKCTPHSVEAAFDEVRRASAKRKILVFGDISDTPRSDRERQTRIGRQAAGTFDVLLFVGEHASFAARSAVRQGAPEECVRTFRSVVECADYLRGELAEGDLVLVKGTGRNHMARVVFGLAGRITCDLPACRKKMLCDSCPELGAGAAALSLVRSFPELNADSTR